MKREESTNQIFILYFIWSTRLDGFGSSETVLCNIFICDHRILLDHFFRALFVRETGLEVD